MVKVKKIISASKSRKSSLGLKSKLKKSPRKSSKLKSSVEENTAFICLPKNVKERKTESSAENESFGLFVKRPVNTPSNVNVSQVREAVSNLFELEKKSSKQDVLFNDEKAIFLQINCIKIPICPTRQIRFNLKHSLILESSEICLITSDLKKGRRVDHEPTIEFYENKLREKGVTRKINILPMHQIKTEYDTFELKRKLVKLYDEFLVDARVSGHISHILGKPFYKKHKLPTPIRLTITNLKESIENGLAKTSLSIHSKGNTFTMQVGHTKMTEEDIFDNILTITNQLDKQFPGGFNNVQCLLLKTAKSLAIPFYFSLKSPNDVFVPVIKSKRPKLFQPFKDELSTRQNRDVTIFPDGKILMSDIKKNVECLDESDEEESDNESFENDEKASDGFAPYMESAKVSDKSKKVKLAEATLLKSNVSEDEEEVKINRAEAEYMQEYEEETQQQLKAKKGKNKRTVGKIGKLGKSVNKKKKQQQGNKVNKKARKSA